MYMNITVLSVMAYNLDMVVYINSPPRFCFLFFVFFFVLHAKNKSYDTSANLTSPSISDGTFRQMKMLLFKQMLWHLF